MIQKNNVFFLQNCQIGFSSKTHFKFLNNYIIIVYMNFHELCNYVMTI